MNSYECKSVEDSTAEVMARLKQRTVEDINRDSVKSDYFREWNAPLRQKQAKNLDRSGEWGKTEALLKSRLGKGFIVGMIGKRGPGKTQMGVELMRECIAQVRSCYYTTVIGYFIDLRATYNRASGDDSERKVLTRYSKYQFLVIDEVGNRGETEWENRMLFEMINRRYDSMKDTLLISNHTRPEFEKAIGESISSRMNETGGLIECTWKSYRE